MTDLIAGLFDTTGFLPRWSCGEWSQAHGWLHIASDLAIWSAYFAIPCVLVHFVRRRTDIPFRAIFWLFGAFILACGTTHLMEALIFWHPHYRLAGAIKLVTALVSWGTVLALVPVVPRALAMKSPDELEREIAAREKAEAALHAANADLENQVSALRASEERFRLLVDGTRDYAIFMLDPLGKVASWNPGAERILEYRAGDIIGRDISLFYPPEDVAAGKPAEELRVAAAAGRYEEEGWRLRRDGSRFWANVILTALPDTRGKLRGFSKITRDMTERRKAEENARLLMEEAAARRAAEAQRRIIEEERERLRVTLRSIGDGVIATDADGRVTLINPIAETLTGWSATEAVGQHLGTVFTILDEISREKVESPVDQVLREGTVVGLGNHTVLISRDGVERPIDDSAAPVKDEQGNLLGVVLVFRDGTERRRAQNEILALNRDLERRDRRKDEFLATLAHELRNPLAPIRTAVELMQRAGNDPVLAREARAILERQVKQMVRLVDDLLEISRITSGKLQLRKERIDLGAVVHAAVEASRPLIESKSHELTVAVPSEPIHLDADPARLSQIVSNLLNNAAKYTEKGGHLWLTAERRGGNAVLTVRDTGIGIPPEDLPHIFEMFSQVSPVLERSQGGLGIGLALVRGLVELHGGSVEARSSPGEGSEFIVTLPASGPATASGSLVARGATPKPIHSALRVLVADDNPDAAESLGLFLRALGHEVRVARDGVEAVQAAAVFKPDVALLDIGMPRMNGYSSARHIRDQEAGSRVVLVALTGWSQEEDRRRAAEAGFDHHLTKPVEPAALEALLARVASRRG